MIIIMVESNSSNIILRLKPMLGSYDRDHINNDISVDNGSVLVQKRGKMFQYNFENILSEDTRQDQFYEFVRDRTFNKITNGTNATFISYGESASGKSYSILGDSDNLGLLPRFVDDLIANAYDIKLTAYYIYENKIVDLFSPDSNDQVKLTRSTGNYDVDSLKEISLLTDGWAGLLLNTQNKIISSFEKHIFNYKSFPAHSVYTIKLYKDDKPLSELAFYDLAGFERLSRAGNIIKSKVSVNIDLMCFKKIIETLKNKKTPFPNRILSKLVVSVLNRSYVTLILPFKRSTETKYALEHLEFAKTFNFIVNI
jgi:hypothetical protein